jgi:hypothetical protein
MTWNAVHGTLKAAQAKHAGMAGTGLCRSIPGIGISTGQCRQSRHGKESRMLRSTRELLGYRIDARDGFIGKVRDLYFDDEYWIVRYLVVRTGFCNLGRSVLIDLPVLGKPDWSSRTVRVDLTCEQVRASPRVEWAKPVSRLYEEKLRHHYSWPMYWGGPYPGQPMAHVPPYIFDHLAESEAEHEAERSHLRSLLALTGYRLEVSGQPVGPAIDFIAKDDDWSLHYLVVQDDSHPKSSKQVLIAVEWIESIQVAKGLLVSELAPGIVHNSPQFDPSQAVNRQYEEVLYDYYGRPKYWQIL